MNLQINAKTIPYRTIKYTAWSLSFLLGGNPLYLNQKEFVSLTVVSYKHRCPAELSQSKGLGLTHNQGTVH